MTRPTALAATAATLTLLATFVSTVSAKEHFGHEDWGEVLAARVDDQGLVDYAGLAADRAALDRTVATVAARSPATHPRLFPTRDHELAYYLNAYNALAIHGVLDLDPEVESVWKGGLVSGYRFFVKRKVVVGGKKTNLRKLENEVIRKRYRDPRIHVALNCASAGCPRLPRTPFVAETLDERLDALTRDFVTDDRHVRVDVTARRVSLSKIFDWFREDFIDTKRGGAGGTLLDWVNLHRPPEQRIPTDFAVDFLPYDKRLNRQVSARGER
ncbi:MAG: DUF547 domain-containing protein [Acidobacteriota bacterium]